VGNGEWGTGWGKTFLVPFLLPTPHSLLASFALLALFASSFASVLERSIYDRAPHPPCFAQRRPILRTAAREYFAGKFVLITRDERPQSLLQPRMLARVADHDLIAPPARVMTGADALTEWAKSVDYAEADGALISFEAIAGGSRQPEPTDFIKWIRARRPGMAIYAFTDGSSDQLTQSALNLVAESTLDFLLISGGGARAKPPNSAQRLSGKVAIEPDLDGATMILLARMLNHRFGFTPKIFLAFSSAAAQDLPLHSEIGATVRAIGGGEGTQPGLPQSNNPAQSVDAALFVHMPQTPGAHPAAMIGAVARDIAKGAKSALA